MKTKLTLCLFFILFFCTMVFAGPFCKLELGPALENNMYFTDINLGFRFTFLNVLSETYGGTRTWSYTDYKKVTGHPFIDTYTIGQKFTYNGFSLNFKHHCTHTVNSEYKTFTYKKEEPIPASDWWYGDVTTISVSYEFELK